jgi:DNA-binding NarL/FixJ family response regulator
MKTDKIRIAIVDDHTLFRNGVAALMREFDDLQVLFEADNGQHMQQMMDKKLLPQVILMDINMPVMDGYAATSWLKEKYPEVKVLALSMFEDDKAVINMIKCGACGYLLKESSPKELLEAITIISQKGMYINELVSGKMIRSITADSDPVFTANEVAFLKLCCTELTYKEIAHQMFISPRTIDNYREALFQKLNVKSRTGLVLYAIQNDVVKL